MAVVYIDILFLTNLLINFILLFAVGKASRTALHRLRMLLAAVLGAGYSVLILLPVTIFLYHPICKLFFSALMLLIAFPFERVGLFFQKMVYFYIISFVFAGASEFANHYFRVLKVQNGLVYFESNFFLLLFSCIAIYPTISFLLRVTMKKQQKEGLIQELLLVRNHRQVRLRGLTDTGNALCDPLTGNPVVIAELSSVKALLTEQEIDAFHRENIPCPLRLIPCRGVEGRMILKGFTPDCAILSGKEIQVTVAVKEEPLCADGSYHAILHSELV